jgi:hypothetical protein
MKRLNNNIDARLLYYNNEITKRDDVLEKVYIIYDEYIYTINDYESPNDYYFFNKNSRFNNRYSQKDNVFI